MKSKLVIEISSQDKIMLESLYKALLPESINPPSEECTANMLLSESRLIIELKCNRVNLLRAVANSYLSIISMIIRGVEGLDYERAKTSS